MSTYYYLLKGVEHRDEDTWGWHLLDVMEQGFDIVIQQVSANRREKGLLALAGPSLSVRQELFGFIACEPQQREGKQYPTIRKLSKALHNQRDQLLTFAGVLDQKLEAIAQRLELPFRAVRDVCLLHRKHRTSNAYWERWNQLYRRLSSKFYGLMEAVSEALKTTPRASSMVENLNSRLRNFFFLRRSPGDAYLSLLQFFLEPSLFPSLSGAGTGGEKSEAIIAWTASPPLARTAGF
ncbi:hypothetical protein [Leptolyngbya sp. BC1307]|uniref:hypothetical protein n=1 Tax=Leptolyngbya sp. BC1307 TaxID=2029589 RepID=UPI001140A149|nr:hypothetical protein [Leptolyngbya sp. BC1307]